MKTKINYLKPIILGCVFTLAYGSMSQAQSNIISDKASLTAKKLSLNIKNNDLLTENVTTVTDLKLTELLPDEKLRHLRQYAFGTIALSNNLDAEEILKVYRQSVNLTGNARDKAVFELHESFLQKVERTKFNKPNDVLLKELETAQTDSDWFVSNTAWLLQSVLNSFANNTNLALQETQEAYKKIPNEISHYVTDARISTLSRTAYLNNLLLSPELAIENTTDLIKQKQAAGYPIDGSSLLNNLLYSLSKWREYEVSTEIAQIVLEIEKEVGSNTPGLTELRVAQLYDQQNDFTSALTHTRNGLAVATIPSLMKHLYFLEINALSGLGKISEAKDKLATLEALPKSGNSGELFAILMTRAKLGIAIAEGNPPEIYRLTNGLLDLNTQKLLRSYNENTAQILASLENTKERQAEREAGLKREANLQKAKAEQQKSLNQLLMILVGLLSIAAILAVVFERYRNKISKELAIKTLEAEDADRMKSEFLGMVSHELRTPLNGIVGIADLLTMQAPNADLRRKAGIILDSSNKLTHVIESIVDMSAIDGQKMELYPEPTNVHDIVADIDKIWRPTIEAKGIIFTSFTERSLAEDLTLDPMRFKQCLNNLLSNAAKFTDNGRIHLHVTAEPIKGSLDTKITAVIADTGQGMNEKVQGKLFTPFLQADTSMTRKHGGSGLGLAITQSLARMMSGDVTMISNEGRGSEFTMTALGQKSADTQIKDIQIEDTQILDSVEALMENMETSPLIETPLATPETPSPLERLNTPDDVQEGEGLRGLRVLFVEGVSSNQDAMKAFLRTEGFDIQSVPNGAEALKMLQVQAMDVVLIDINMSDMDGTETAQTIRRSERNYKDIPIIALTENSSAEANAALMRAGMDIFLAKPVKFTELTESVRFVCSLKQDTALKLAV